MTRYTIGEETLTLILEGKARPVKGVKLRYGRYRIVKRYIVKGVVYGCKSEG